jgi:hypothetical protein
LDEAVPCPAILAFRGVLAVTATPMWSLLAMEKCQENAESLRREIAHLQNLIRGLSDPQALASIRYMIEELERRLAALEQPGGA